MRQARIDHYRANPAVSVLIIGAGINGIGTFRDLALQGVDVLLVDRGDFCAGASAASSHMVHGGVRYLENGEFRLVREAVQERNRLLANAPHYVKPLPTTFPIFKWGSGLLNAPLKFLGLLDKPSERGALVIKIGLTLYDAYTTGKTTVPRHEFLLQGASLAKYPQVNPDIVCTATYYDGAMSHPERIGLENVLDGEATNPQAHALNYVSAAGADANTVLLRDEVTGDTFEVQPQIVINAAGPWIDFANNALGQSTKFIGGTKGSHLVLDHPELRAAIGENEFFFENHDGRIVLIYPYQERVLIGTSDIAIDDPDEARCTDAEIDYFFEMISRVFPKINVNRSQIVFTFSGVRPLPANNANTTGQISRDHSIRELLPDESGFGFPVYSLVGGKWTSFRAFAEQTTDKLLAELGQPRKLDTKARPFGGGVNYPTDQEEWAWLNELHQRTSLPVEQVKTLFANYGTYAAPMAEFISQAEDMPLTHKPDMSRCEIQFIAQQEKVVHLDDLLLRRTLLAMLGYVTADLLTELGQVVGEALGWSAEQQAEEVARASQLLQERHRMSL